MTLMWKINEKEISGKGYLPRVPHSTPSDGVHWEWSIVWRRGDGEIGNNSPANQSAERKNIKLSAKNAK